MPACFDNKQHELSNTDWREKERERKRLSDLDVEKLIVPLFKFNNARMTKQFLLLGRLTCTANQGQAVFLN